MMIIVYIILFTTTLLVVGAVWCAYEIGRNVGIHETQRKYQTTTTESRK